MNNALDMDVALDSTCISQLSDRFPWWRVAACNELVPVVIESKESDNFRAKLRVSDVGVLRVTDTTYPSMRAQRTKKQIEQSDPQMYQMWCDTRGEVGFDHTGKNNRLRPQQLMLCDTSKQFSSETFPDRGKAIGIILQFPKSMFPMSSRTLESLIGRPLSSREGLSRAVVEQLACLTQGAEGLSAIDRIIQAEAVIDSLIGWCCAVLMPDQPKSGDVQQAQVAIDYMETIFNERKKSSPAAIAKALAISSSRLRSVLRAAGFLSTSAWIHNRRMKAGFHKVLCTDDPINEIAESCGFPAHHNFTAAFSRRYGVAPTEIREIKLKNRNTQHKLAMTAAG